MAGAKHQSALARWYARFAAFDVAALFSQKREPGPPRTVYVHESLPESYVDHKGKVKPAHVYSTNQVITSKYTVFTFLPRNLLEQFRRIANMCVSHRVSLLEGLPLTPKPQILPGYRHPPIFPEILDYLTWSGDSSPCHYCCGHSSQGWL